MNPSIVPSRFWGPGLVVFAAAVATVFAGRPASTCSIAGLADHTLDAGELAADTHPPSAPQVSAVNVQRAERSGGGCGAGSFPDPDACGGLASVKIVVSAIDDRTTSPEMGYRLSVASGIPPAGMTIPSKDVRINWTDSIVLTWFESDPDEQPAVDFELQIFAVDRGGNVSSTAAVVRVHSPREGGGCAVVQSPRGKSMVPLSFVAAAALAWARRRRVRTSCSLSSSSSSRSASKRSALRGFAE